MSIEEIATKIGERTEARSIKLQRSSLFVKLLLVVGGASIGAIAHTVELAHANDDFSLWSIVGLSGAIFVGVGAAFLAFTEKDASEELEHARKAIDEAKIAKRDAEQARRDTSFEQEAIHEQLVAQNKETMRALQLYNSMDVMRGAIEQALGSQVATTEKNLIQACLSAAENSLALAFDFETKDTWTINIYKAENEKESGRVVLRCVATKRKISLDDLMQARTWYEGEGLAGIAYGMGCEIVLRDLAAPELGGMFYRTAKAISHDEIRYRSVAATPISLQPLAQARPWGVAVVTTDRVGHFYPDTGEETFVPPVQPLRAIAAMAVLAVKAVKRIELSAADAAAYKPDGHGNASSPAKNDGNQGTGLEAQH